MCVKGRGNNEQDKKKRRGKRAERREGLSLEETKEKRRTRAER
jgi:hypothetical protein